VGQRDVAILIAFAALNVQLHAGSVDLGHSKPDALAKAQATGLDHTQADLIVGQVDLAEDLPDFIGAEHDGELVCLGWADQLQQWSEALEGALEEEHNRAERHSTAHSTAGARSWIASRCGLGCIANGGDSQQSPRRSWLPAPRQVVGCANYGQLMLLLYRSSFVLRLITRLRCAAVKVYFPLGPM